MPINPSREYTYVAYRRGGPGNLWEILDVEGAMTAPSGGGVSVESIWARGPDGQRAYIGLNRTSNPERFTFDVMYRLMVENILKELTLAKCPVDWATVYKCGDLSDPNNFDAILQYVDGQVTSHTFDANIANSAEQTSDQLMKQLSVSAGLSEIVVPVQHADISKTITDVAINQIIALAPAQCAGDCGEEKDGSEELAFVTDLDSAPGYAGTSAPYLGYSDDKGNTWTLTSIDDFLTANATGIVKAGNYLVVFSPSHAPSYVSLDKVRGTLTPTDFVKSTIKNTNGTVITSNFPSYGIRAPGGVLYAFGDGGYVYKSTDNGFSWNSIDDASTTPQNLLAGAVATDDVIWIGGASGTLLKINKGVISLVTVTDTDGNTLTANITAMAVPDGRSNQLYLGTAGGEIWKSVKTNVTAPEFTRPAFENSGVGSIDVLSFIGFKGSVLWIVQSNAANQSRVLRDRSGGALGTMVGVIGSFTSPSNIGINSLIPIDVNTAYTVGEVDDSQGFIGKISP